MSSPGTDPWAVAGSAPASAPAQPAASSDAWAPAANQNGPTQIQTAPDPWAPTGKAQPDSPYLGMAEQLEDSAAAVTAHNKAHPDNPITVDQVVSPAGAVGRYQVMPSTARLYGLDPSQLTDPAYNRLASNLILQDLHKQFGDDRGAIAVAYNDGPARAKQWLNAGRDLSVLPPETRGYLERATDPWAPDWTAPPQTFSQAAPQSSGKIGQLPATPGAVKANQPTGKPEASWQAVLSPDLATAWDRLKLAGVNLAQWAYDADPTKPTLMGVPIPFGQTALNPAQQKQLAAAQAPVDQWAAKARADLATDIKSNAPALNPGSAKSYTYQALSGLTEMVPVLAATAATKDPMVGAAIMGAQAGSQAYGQAIADGRTHAQASMDATFDTMVNGGLGLLPMHALMAPGGSFLKKTLTNAGAFGVQSVATEALQIGYDKGIVGKDMTLKDAWQRLEDAGVVGTLTGALLGGGHAGLEAAVGRLRANTPEASAAPQERVEPTAAPAGQEVLPTPPRYAAGPIHADLMKSVGLDKAGVAPTPDPWAPATSQTPVPTSETPVPTSENTEPLGASFRTTPAQIIAEHQAELSSIDAQGTANAAARLPSAVQPAAPAPEAAAVDSNGIPRRELAADTAFTSTGRMVPVHYAVVEAAHLVPSQTPDGNPNPNFPAELQPRDRARAVSQAQISQIAQNINPRLLDQSPNASDGAPIIAASGVVESGNGRSLALQRAYAEGMPSAEQYRDYLAQQGYPVEGMTAPVLVRVRDGEMAPADRQAFVREANQSGQLGYSATERAMSDAAALPDSALDLYRGGDVEQAGNRDFVRAFMQSAVPANEHAGMVDSHGALSQEAVRRVRGALLAKAYADPDLIGQIVESQDSNTKAIGGALTDVAADWAKMRGMVASGDIPPSLDQTSKLLEAVQLVNHARETGRNVAEFVSQPDIFTGESIDPDVEAWLRLMFRNTKDWTGPVGRDKLADALRFYAQEAQKAHVGQNLLGEEPVAPSEVLQAAKDRQSGQRSAQTSPSLSLGQGVRPFGRAGARAETESPAPGGGEGFAEGRNQPATDTAPHVIPGKFGPRPYSADLREAKPGEQLYLGQEVRDFVRGAGATPEEPVKGLQALANYVYMRGHKFGAETLASMSALPGRAGSVHANTDGRKNAVSFRGQTLPDMLDPNKRLITLHNHPSSMGLSDADVASLAYPGHAAMVVIAHDGNFHVAELAAKMKPGASRDTAANYLSSAHRIAREMSTRYMDPLYRSGFANVDDADYMSSHITQAALERAGLIDYMGSRPIAPHLAEGMAKTIEEAADAIKQAFGRGIDGVFDLADRSAQGAYRHAEPVQFTDAMARIFERAGQNAGQPGSAERAQPGAATPDVYRKPQQLQLLDEAKREAQTPEFKAWFGDSVVKDANGQPLVVYRGQHGTGDGLESRAGSLTFGSQQAANTYAMHPNDRADEPQAPKLIPAFLNIRKPFVADGDDPFIDMARFEKTLGRDRAIAIAKKHAAALQHTNNWEDNFAAQYDSVGDLLAKHPEQVGQLYGDAHVFMDDPAVVKELQAKGFDGAIHGGAGETSGESEYRVFSPDQVRTSIGGMRENERRYEAERGPLYSQLTRSIEESKLTRAPAKDWSGLIDNLRNKGVKQEEIEWSGVKDWLGQQTGPVTKDQVLEHLRENEVKVQEVTKGGPPQEAVERLARQFARNNDEDSADLDARDWQKYLDEAREELAGPNDTKFSEYVLPGGENYRELLMTLPPAKIEPTQYDVRKEGGRFRVYPRGSDNWVSQHASEAQANKSIEASNFRDQMAASSKGNFKSSHFDEPNIVAHVRFDDRTGPNGEKILHMAEVQSDWHQRGRKEGYKKTSISADDNLIAEKKATGTGIYYEVKTADGRFVTNVVPASSEATPDDAIAEARERIRNRPTSIGHDQSVPDAPFKSSWHELALKRMLRYAAEHGYDKLTWDTGDTQADRYDLSKQISRIDYRKSASSGLWSLDQIESSNKGHGRIVAYDHSGRVVLNEFVDDEKKIPDMIGKDAADKLLAETPTREYRSGAAESVRKIEGLQLKVGGDGMRGFYDKIVPNFLSKYAKKWGAKLGTEKLTTSPERAGALKGDLSKRAETADVHSLEITPAMRESVMQGQPLFDEGKRYKEEPGAVDARGNALPQTIIPGGEQSATQLAKAREAAGHGLKTTKAGQKEPGGLFGGGESDLGQGSLFEDEKRYADMAAGDRDQLERAARTGDWIGKYRDHIGDATDKVRASIAAAFENWRRNPSSVPNSVRAIFEKADGELPSGFSDLPTTRPTSTFADKVKAKTDSAMDLVHDVQMLVAPMAEGTGEARAAAKDFANLGRLARYHGQRMMESLKKNFDHRQLRAMWEAADEESVARQKGEPTAGIGLAKLTPEERRAVLEQQTDAQNVWDAAKAVGIVKSEGLPSYVPRMMVKMADTGYRPLGDDSGARSIPGMGRNLRTSTGQTLHRKYMTTEETEKAGSTKFGTAANVVKDIRTLPLATMRLREAVAGRALINKIKELGDKTGDDTVVEGHEPAGTPYKWFTLDHPSFKTWRPKYVTDPESGKIVGQKDQNGETVFEKVPIFVRGDFEGPLRAVLSQDSGKVYNALMNMKGRAMQAIMYSPIIHNAVEWGRALPAMPGKVATFKIYFEGNRAKHDPEVMTEAVMHGLAPIGHNFGSQDITSMMDPDSIKAGRSWTAKVLGAIPNLFSKDAGQSVYRAIDRMGDVWHNTLLWDRVGDLQMGLYTNMRDHAVKSGMDPDAAQYVAAHFANRYAGALPLESMSNAARKLANLALFSRTYTLGNLGAMKDVVTGLPRDVQAQIERTTDAAGLSKIKSMARRKAATILLTDIALFYAGNSILQSAVSYMTGRQDLSQIEQGYLDRLNGLLHKVDDSPLDLLNPFADMQALSATSENEKGRENRVLVGYDKDGTAIYARNPIGKIGEEFTNWLTSPLTTLKSKFSTVLRPTYATITNDAGFGRHVYDPNATGVKGIAQDLGRIVELYMGSQVPLDSLKSGASMLTGSGTKLDTYKAVGPLAGVTFSKGAPGGPAVGALYALREEHTAQQAEAMPGIIAKIKAGDQHGARTDMRALGMAPGLQNYYIRTTLNPRLRLNTRSSRELIQHATPEERALIQKLRGQNP